VGGGGRGGPRMLVHEHVSRWPWANEHGQIFFEILSWCRWNTWKILFDTWDIIFGDVEEYFTMCSWMKDIQGWNFGWQMKMDDFFHECWQHFFLWKIEPKKNRMEKITLVYFEKFDTWNVEVIFYISLIWSILNFTTSKPYIMLN
jgi:hypothetical protein